MSRTCLKFLILSALLHSCAFALLHEISRPGPAIAFAAPQALAQEPNVFYLETASVRTHSTQAVPRPAPMRPLRAEPEAPGTSSVAGASLEKYLREVREVFASRQVYPEPARLKGETGTVEVGMKIRRDGKLEDVQVTRPSPFESLNRAALALFREVARVPALPPDVPGEALSLRIPLEYVLAD